MDSSLGDRKVSGSLGEAAIGSDRDAAGVDVLEDGLQSISHELGGLDPGILDVDQADRDIHGLRQLAKRSTSAISRLANSRAS